MNSRRFSMLDGHLYLVERKWLKERAARAEVASHLVSIYGRADAVASSSRRRV
jgi:hypothetical protein